jgi:DNA polymerase-3 subunit delta'
VAEKRRTFYLPFFPVLRTLKLGPINPADIVEALSTRLHTDAARAAQVAHIAMGSYTEALRLVRHAENDLFPEVRNLFNNIFTNNGIGIGKFGRMV